MKRYKTYMDTVKAPDSLHERLEGLEAPEKLPRPWAKWGALAAAVALAVGAGIWAAGLLGNQPAVGTLDREEAAAPDLIPAPSEGPGGALTTTAPAPEPCYAPSDPPGPDDRYGYEVRDGDTVGYFFLPALDWADASLLSRGQQLDYCLAPPGALRREAGREDVPVLCGGEAAMRDHLLWDGLDWGGVLWFLEDGAPQAVSLYADGERLHLSLEIMRGGEVPSCIVFPEEEYARTEFLGVEITALKNVGTYVLDDGAELRESREVSLLVDGTGYKLTLYAADADQAGMLCARFVRYALDRGFRLDALSAGGAEDNSHYSVGEPGRDDAGGNAEARSFPFGPDGAAAPSSAPALPDRGEPPATASEPPAADPAQGAETAAPAPFDPDGCVPTPEPS